MRGIYRYYWRWLRTSLGYSWDLAQGIAGSVSILGLPLALVLRLRDSDKIVTQLTWQISLAVFVGLSLFRLIAAPYWMQQEDEAKRRAERAEEEKNRAELEARAEAEQAQRLALLDDRRKREDQMECLAVLMKEGDRLRVENVNAAIVSGWLPRYQEWIERVETEVGRRFSPSDAARLITLVHTTDYKVGVPGPHQRGIARIAAILNEMHAMSRSLLTQT